VLAIQLIVRSDSDQSLVIEVPQDTGVWQLPRLLEERDSQNLSALVAIDGKVLVGDQRLAKAHAGITYTLFVSGYST